MPGPYGLTPQGFSVKPQEDIKAELDGDFKVVYGDSIGSEPDGSIPPESAIGQFIGIFSADLGDLWDLGQVVYASRDPDAAEDAALVALCAITGTVPRGARQSQALLAMTGDPGTVLDVGRVVSVVGAKTRFDTIASVTLALATSWAASFPYSVGDRATNDTPAKVYEVVGAGTSAASGGPTGTGSAIVDGATTWRYVGLGTAYADVIARAEQPGPFAAVAGALSVIETPVSGWRTAVNLLDASVGALAESNPALRLRRENELQGEALGTLDAIRANFLKVGESGPNPVTACTVFQNTTMVPNADGLPPKSVEILVLGGDDADLFKEVLRTVDAGIESYGNQVGSAVDSAGNSWVVKFSRPTLKPVYIELDLAIIDGKYPLDGDAQVKAAVIAALQFPAHSFGTDVTAFQITAPLDQVAGVFDVVDARLGLTPGPVGSARITVGVRELATFDTSRIVVSTTPTTP